MQTQVNSASGLIIDIYTGSIYSNYSVNENNNTIMSIILNSNMISLPNNTLYIHHNKSRSTPLDINSIKNNI